MKLPPDGPVHHKLPKRSAEPAFGPCIDWNDGKWRPVCKAADKARARIDAGRKLHGERFVVRRDGKKVSEGSLRIA